jgi:hypothetical protein
LAGDEEDKENEENEEKGEDQVEMNLRRNVVIQEVQHSEARPHRSSPVLVG